MNKSIYILIVSLLLEACCTKVTYQKRRYQKGHFFVKHHKHLPPKHHSISLLHFNPVSVGPKVAFNEPIRISEFIKKEPHFVERKDAKPPLYAEKHSDKKTHGASKSKKIQIKALPDKLKPQVTQFFTNKYIKEGDGWKTLLKVIAVIALLLFIIGIIYLGLIMILIGGVLTGGAIFSEARFILFLILLALLVIGSVLLSLYILNC